MNLGELPDILKQHNVAIDDQTVQNIQIVDLKFTDLLGTWQHFSMAPHQIDNSVFTEGVGFDGSSIRAFQGIERSDMVLIPDMTTAVIDPMSKYTTLSFICDIRDPVTGEPYHKDPRGLARRAEAYLTQTGIADTSYWGPEPEFFIFDDARYDNKRDSAYYYIDSVEAAWNTGRVEAPNLAYKTDHKAGYFPVAPRDTLQDVRTEMTLEMAKMGVDVEIHHHEVGTAGQCEIDMRYSPLTNMADNVMIYKYVVKTVARRNNKTATFMPKPIFEDNGSGMHTHQSLWKDGTNLFFDATGYGMISELARYYIGGADQARPSNHGHLRAHNQQLQAPGAGLRGAERAGL